MCSPFHEKHFTSHQPDGTQLDVIGWGNGYHAVFQALNDYTVVKDPVTGYYVYADVTSDGDELVPTAGRPRFSAQAQLNLAPALRVSEAAAKQTGADRAAAMQNGLRWKKRRTAAQQPVALLAATEGIAGAPPKRGTTGH